MSSILFIFLLPYEDYFYKKNYLEAIRYAKLAYKIFLEDETLYYLGISELCLDRLPAAMANLEELTKKKEDASFYLGIIHYRLGNYIKAMAYMNDARDVFLPKYSYLTLIHLKDRDLKEAEKYLNSVADSYLKETISQWIKNYQTLVDAKNAFIDMDYQRTIELINKVEDFFGYKEIGLALAYERLGDYQKSLIFLDTVIRNPPSYGLLLNATYNAGRIEYALRNYKRAEGYLRDYLSTQENNAAKFLLGKIFMEEGNLDSASIYFKDLPDTIDEYLFYKGRIDYFRGMLASAEERLLLHREYFPNSFYADSTVYILGEINFKQGKYRLAIDYWTDLINLYPNSNYAAVTAKKIGDAYFNLKRYNDALEFYKRVKDFGPQNELKLETELKILETKYQLGLFNSLIGALNRFIETYSDSVNARDFVAAVNLRIAMILFEKEEYYSALEKLNQLITKYSDLSVARDAILQRAKVFRKIGDKNGEKASLKILLERKDIRELYPYVVNELGTIYKNEMKYDSALYYYNLLLKIEMYREIALLEIARIYNSLGRYEEAELVIERFINEYPNSSLIFDAYILKSETIKNQGDYNKAVNVLKELSDKYGPKPEVFLRIADIYVDNRNYQAARDYFLRASEYFKENRDDAARSLIRAGDVSLIMGDIKIAKELYLKAALFALSIDVKQEASKKLTSVNE